MLIDLQFHSTYSDGSLTPTQLASFLKKFNVKVAALTDHNTVAGLDEFFKACKKNRIKPIAGIELYVRYGSKKMNFLFYNFDKDAPEFHKFLRQTQIKRYKNVVKALKFWQEKGFDINIENILSQYNHYIPINGIIRSIRKNPENEKIIRKDLQTDIPHEWEIIRYYFKNKKRYFLNETYVDISRLQRLHQKIGGQIILAHPSKQHIKKELMLKMIDEKLIDGVEILSPHHSWDTISYYQHILKGRNIIISGGSDFHGFDKIKSRLNCSWKYFSIDTLLLKNINRIIKIK